MSEVIIVDPVPTNRAALIHQLGLIEPYSILQFGQYSAAELSLQGSDSFQGLIFVTISEGMEKFGEFTKKLRLTNNEACVIAVLGNVTLEEMQALVQYGVDQVLLRPFSTHQLRDKIKAAQAFRQQILTEATFKPSEAHFETRVDELADRFYKVTLGGWLAENCALPDIKPRTRDCTLFLECDPLRGINSIGIRLWMLWIRSLTANGFVRFEFENLRPAILQQASFVHGFIPPNGTVNSFYLYYSHPETDEEREFKLARGKDFATDQMRIPAKREVDENGQKAIYEVDPGCKRYLKFFPGKIMMG